MSEARDDPELHWVDPRRRGIFPLSNFHISRSLRRSILRPNYTIRTDVAFDEVVAACAARPETWINAELHEVYANLFGHGHAHSVEVHADEGLVGGVFGVTLGAAFFGESMFSRRTDASKIALAYLVDRLKRGGFRLFDAQFLTPHLKSLGAIEVSRGEYHRLLGEAVDRPAFFEAPGDPPSPQVLLAGFGL
jgi:leucyl/phenylalanyl-tRNA--protein transferase